MKMGRPFAKLAGACLALIGVAVANPVVISPVAAAGPGTALDLAFTGTLTAPVLWLGGGGSFSFNTAAPLGCMAAGQFGGQMVSGTCTITATGSYTNIICGEYAEFGGVANIDTAVGTLSVTFSIIVFGSVGPVTGSTSSSSDILGGVVELTANSPQYPGFNCTSSFTVAGDLVVQGA
jgi:hypothetical protein